MWFDSLTAEQQELLLSTGKEAGIYNNELQAEADTYYMDLMVKEGVTVYEPTAEDIKAFQDAALGFYSDKDVTANWTPDLYNIVKAAMGAN